MIIHPILNTIPFRRIASLCLAWILVSGAIASGAGAAESTATLTHPGPSRLPCRPLPGGTYTKGTTDGLHFEGPLETTTVAGLLVGITPVTVAQFRKFVDATSYVTEGEKIGWGGVFLPDGKGWRRVEGATWSQPEGPRRPPAKDNHPVTQVSWNDARAYAKWAGGRLPTEAEWEYFARGGQQGWKYPWGNELNPGEKYMANYWQGAFPAEDRGEDGFRGTSPVGSFPANGYGLYDVAGNVWEFTEDVFGRDPQTGEDMVTMRGGSWLCNESFCQGYRVAARNSTGKDSGLNNLGFRVVFDPK